VSINVTRSMLPEFENYVDGLRRLWTSRWLTNNGTYVQELEKRLADYLGVPYVVVVSNGTLALMIALSLFDFKPGDEIITTPFTFIATTSSIVWQHLIPVFADIDSGSFNISPPNIEDKITYRTKAIMPVHVFGNPADVEAIEKIAKKYNLKVIYDAAHAFGVKYKGKSILNWGDVSVLSFHATKVFHTIEGGALVLKDKNLYEKAKAIRDFGFYPDKEHAPWVGMNAKLNEFQALMGLLNLDIVDKEIERRKTRYGRYKANLQGIVEFQKLNENLDRYNYIYFPVLLPSNEKREKLYTVLAEQGINTRRYFYPLTYEFEAYQKYASLTPNAYDISRRILHLPLYGELDVEIIDGICEMVRRVVADE